MPRPRAKQPPKPPRTPQVEQDGVDVLEFLKKFPLKEFTRTQIARGSGVPDNYRIRIAVPHARRAAEKSGARVENYMRSRDPNMHGAYTLRLVPIGKGDSEGARDALHSSRTAISAMEDMRRSCEFESKNKHSLSPAGFGQVATAVSGCLITVESVGELNEQLWKSNRDNLRLAKRIAELEAERAALGHD